MKELEKAQYEQAVGVGWFDGQYTEAAAKLVAEMQGLAWHMIEYFYGREYEKQEKASHGYH